MIQNRFKQAFTMIEMIVVVALIGVIMAFVLPRIAKYISKAGEAEVKFKFSGIKESLQEYRLEFGGYPSTKEGLMALVRNPRPNDERYKRVFAHQEFLKEDQITDKQGNEFTYHCPPERYKDKYRQFEIIYEPLDNPDNVLHDGV